MLWIVNANTNTCRIYHYQRNSSQLIEVKEIQHEENKLKDKDLISDKPGHYKTSNSTRGAYSQQTDPKEHKIDCFSRQIANELEQGRTDQAFDKLIIIAPSHMYGLLCHHMDKQIKTSINYEIQKDLVHLSAQELLNYLKTHTQCFL